LRARKGKKGELTKQKGGRGVNPGQLLLPVGERPYVNKMEKVRGKKAVRKVDAFKGEIRQGRKKIKSQKNRQCSQLWMVGL